MAKVRDDKHNDRERDFKIHITFSADHQPVTLVVTTPHDGQEVSKLCVRCTELPSIPNLLMATF